MHSPEPGLSLLGGQALAHFTQGLEQAQPNSPPQDDVATQSGRVYTHVAACRPPAKALLRCDEGWGHRTAQASCPLPWADHASGTVFCNHTNRCVLEGEGLAGKCWILNHRDEQRQPWPSFSEGLRVVGRRSRAHTCR